MVFVTFKTVEDAAKMTAKAKNLPKKNLPNDPRIIMYVDQRAKKRYDSIQNIAKTIRVKSNNTIQTTVRNGKRDFLLRQKDRGDPTPWSQIPPLKLEEEIPEFEIGQFKNIYSNEENDKNEALDENNEYENEEEKDEQNELSNEIARQYMDEEKAKRDRSEDAPQGEPRNKFTKKLTFHSAGSEDEIEGENVATSQPIKDNEVSFTLNIERRMYRVQSQGRR